VAPLDHKTDPLELDNLAEKTEYHEKVQALALELRKKWRSDFLNNGKPKKNKTITKMFNKFYK